MKSIKEILPKELRETLNRPEFDNDAGLLIDSVKFNDEILLLTFSIRFNKNELEKWCITIDGIKKEQITRNWSQNIEIYKDHILLLEYHDIHTELYFSGITLNSNELFVDIVQSLTLESDNIFDVADYILPLERIRELSSQGYGLFARGPKAILKIYEQCLLRQNIKPIFIGEYQPSLEDKSLRLLILGESYFIGENFRFERQPVVEFN